MDNDENDGGGDGDVKNEAEKMKRRLVLVSSHGEEG